MLSRLDTTNFFKKDVSIYLPVENVSLDSSVWEKEEPAAHQLRDIGENITCLYPCRRLIERVPSQRCRQR